MKKGPQARVPKKPVRRSKRVIVIARGQAARPDRRALGERSAPPVEQPLPSALQHAGLEVELVDVPAFSALAVEGHGAIDVDGGAFRVAIADLVLVASVLRADRESRGRGTFAAGPLSARCHDEAPSSLVPPGLLPWRLRLALPGDVGAVAVAEALAAAHVRQAFASAVFFERVSAQRCARLLHVGPITGVRATLEALRRKATALGGRADDEHLEVYLDDPTSTPSDMARTVLCLGLRAP